MVKQAFKALVMSGILAVITTSTQTARAAERGEGADARQAQVKMSFSGSMIPTAIGVQPDTITDEELLAGSGSFGQFTFRALRTDEMSPIGFGSCGDGFGPSIRVVAGGGVFRFEDGSLVMVNLTDGVLCIDFDHLVGHLTETYQITGGTGRFKSASGTLQVTKRLKPVMVSPAGQAVLLTITGELKGTIRGSSEKG